MTQFLDGFWLPQLLKQEYLSPETNWITLKYKDGRPTESDGPGVVGVRWPHLSITQWGNLLTSLRKACDKPPKDFFPRLSQVLHHLSSRFNDPTDLLYQVALKALPSYTGYSREMIQFVLGSLDMMPVASLEKAVQLHPPDAIRNRFIAFNEFSDLDGRLRLYESNTRNPFQQWLKKSDSRALWSKLAKPEFVLGFAAGNVIGTSHLISLLGQVSAFISTVHGDALFPAILIKNSRQEPIFTKSD